MLGFMSTWRSQFIGINRHKASAEENAPYGKINVWSRSSSNVNSNPRQTQWSSMGSIPGHTWARYVGHTLLRQRTM